MSETIHYLRKGRKLRCSGTIVGVDQRTGLTKVKPLRTGWKIVFVTTAEIEAGREKSPFIPRKKADPSKPRKPRTPRPTPKPRWQQLIDEVRTLETDHHPEGWPAVKMSTLTELADELQAAHEKLCVFLPIHSTTKP